MAWQKFTRTRINDRETPTVTISKSHFYFNAVASKLCDLRDGKRVVYHIDENDRRIGFEFTDEDEDHSYSVFRKSNSSSFRSSPNDVYANFAWVKAISVLSDSQDRRFQLRPEGKFWVARLRPSFELRVGRSEAKSIPNDAEGIYRYLRDGRAVYIGKGNVRSRLGEVGRRDWAFDSIEYSVVEDDKRQYDAESYWIDRHRAAHGELPEYNLIAGHGR